MVYLQCRGKCQAVSLNPEPWEDVENRERPRVTDDRSWTSKPSPVSRFESISLSPWKIPLPEWV